MTAGWQLAQSFEAFFRPELRAACGKISEPGNRTIGARTPCWLAIGSRRAQPA
jgi:hypothetical protein